MWTTLLKPLKSLYLKTNEDYYLEELLICRIHRIY